MGKVETYRRGLSAFIASDKGQRFFNFAYSIGAAIVIWGALFKILHLPGGTALLSIGMGTEVLMFILTAFDRPPKEYEWEEVFPQLKKKSQDGKEIAEGSEFEIDAPANGVNVVINGTGIPASGTVVINGGASGAQANAEVAAAPAAITPPTDFASATQLYIDQITSLSEGLQKLQESTAALNHVSETLLQSYQAITEHSAEINDSSTGYVEQMQTLNHNINGLNTIYEIQLKSVSSQLDAIDRVNRGIKDIRDMFEKSASQSTRYCEETEKMARYMQQLNSVYERMITAMTINMYNPLMTSPATAQAPATENKEPNDKE